MYDSDMIIDTDAVIVGAGVVGLAVSAELAARYGSKGSTILVVERNSRIGQETSSRNSEVIHAGIYYPVKSLKATLCVEGAATLRALATKERIPHKITGKLIVASDEQEVGMLEELSLRGNANGVRGLRMIDGAQLKKHVPGIKGTAALFSPDTGIVDSWELMMYLKGKMEKHGGVLAPMTEVIGLRSLGEGLEVTAKTASRDMEKIRCRLVINAAGLYADRLASLAGIDVKSAGYRQQYCKGQYFRLRKSSIKGVEKLVYPVPRHLSGGLGVHFTLDLAGSAKLGPDACYIPREDPPDYSVNEELADDFVAAARRYLPHLGLEDLQPDTAGVRPRIYGPGEPARDFIIRDEADRSIPGLINLVGIESPGLTAAIAIARYVAEMAKPYLQ